MKQKHWNIIIGAVAIIALVVSIFNVTPFEITSDTYIGIIATFIGISVAFLVGFQIYNSLEIKEKINQLNNLNEKIREHEEIINLSKETIEGNLQFLQGRQLLTSKQYIGAFSSFNKALSCLLLTSNNRARITLTCLKQTIFQITEETTIKQDDYDFIINIKEKIESNSSYPLIREEYQSIFITFHSKVKLIDKQ